MNRGGKRPRAGAPKKPATMVISIRTTPVVAADLAAIGAGNVNAGFRALYNLWRERSNPPD